MPTTEENVRAVLGREHVTDTEITELLAMGPAAHDVLVRYAQGQTPADRSDFRGRAIYVLGRSTNPAHTQVLSALLPTLDQTDRLRALLALGKQGSDAALTAIEQYLASATPTNAEVLHSVTAIARSGNTNSQTVVARIRARPGLDPQLVAQLDNINTSTGIA